MINQVFQHRIIAIVGLILMTIGAFRGKAIISSFLTDWAMSQINSVMTRQGQTLNTLPRFGEVNSQDISAPFSLLRAAVDLDATNTTARWALGRIAISIGDSTLASTVLEPLLGSVHQNPLLYIDILIGYSRSNNPQRLTDLVESTPLPLRTTVLSDTIAVAYLDLGDAQSLDKARNFRPNDLYINYSLWKEAEEDRAVYDKVQYRERLERFQLDAIAPADDRLLEYVARVIPQLLDNGIWDKKKSQIVVSYLVWQHAESPAVEKLILDLATRFSNEPQWLFYLAEMYHRRGDLELSEQTYRQIVHQWPDFSPGYLRLGMVSEERCGAKDPARDCLLKALDSYEKYHKYAPDDLAGLKRFIAVAQLLQRTDVQSLQSQLDQLVGPNGAEQTANLVVNSSFDRWKDNVPTSWIIDSHVGNVTRDDGLCTAGPDDFGGISGTAARVTCFWFGQQTDKEPGRYGIWLWFEDENNHIETKTRFAQNQEYKISLDYRTADLPNGMVHLIIPGLLNSDVRLPATEREWRSFKAVDVSEGDNLVRPLINVWAPGEVWLDNIEIYEVSQ